MERVSKSISLGIGLRDKKARGSCLQVGEVGGREGEHGGELLWVLRNAKPLASSRLPGAGKGGAKRTEETYY